MNPITLPLPVWTWDGANTCRASVGSLRLDVYSHRLGWKWLCIIPGAKVPLQDFYVYSDTPEAAQAAAWDALAKWLGATV